MCHMFLLEESGNLIYIKNEVCIATLANTISTSDSSYFIFADEIRSIHTSHAIFAVCLKLH